MTGLQEKPVETPGPPRRPRPLGTWIGLAMILVGVGLLGWVGWQFYGTNWVAHRQQDKITQGLVRQWADRSPRATAEPSPLPGQATALVRIPKFGKSYVVPVLEGTSEEVLAKGYGHVRGTAAPGQVGNYAIAAHRVTHGEPLRHMPDLRPGDQIRIETATTDYTYRLDTNPNDLVIPFTGVWVLKPVPHNPGGGVEPTQQPGQHLITLMTCSELFHTDNRMIAFGHLVSSRPK